VPLQLKSENHCEYIRLRAALKNEAGIYHVGCNKRRIVLVIFNSSSKNLLILT
jgi:hypothetical protein